MSTIPTTCLALFVCAGCVVHYPPPPRPPPPPPPYSPPRQASPPSAQAPSSALPSQSDCGPSIPGLNQLAHPGAMLLLADVPGSEQIPDFVSDAACQEAESGVAVFIGLEIPEQEQSRIDEFIHSAGAEADRARLLEGEFWRRPQQDGRSSKAVLQLIDDVRQMTHKGYRVMVFAYDASPGQGPDRNAAMAQNIEAARERAPEALFIVLASNPRVRTGAGEPLVAQLRRKERWLTSLTAAFDNGTAWTCEGPKPPQIQCSAHPIRGRRPGPFPASVSPGGTDNRFIAKWPRPAPDGNQGNYYVGALTASPPALDAQAQGRATNKSSNARSI